MNKYVTIVQYIDVRTGEIIDTKEIRCRNFREMQKEEVYQFNKKNGNTERTINHYGIIGSAGKGNRQFRLL